MEHSPSTTVTATQELVARVETLENQIRSDEKDIKYLTQEIADLKVRAESRRRLVQEYRDLLAR